jgi:hypothetical protein
MSLSLLFGMPSLNVVGNPQEILPGGHCIRLPDVM